MRTRRVRRRSSRRSLFMFTRTYMDEKSCLAKNISVSRFRFAPRYAELRDFAAKNSRAVALRCRAPRARVRARKRRTANGILKL